MASAQVWLWYIRKLTPSLYMKTTLTTVDEGIYYYLKWIRSKSSKATVKNYTDVLRLYARFVTPNTPFCDVELWDVIDYLNMLEDMKFARKTIYNRATVIREMYRFVKRQNAEIFFDPDDIPVMKPNDTLRYRCSDKDMQQSLSCDNLRRSLIMHVLMDTGIRIAELAEIRRESIDTKTLQIEIVSKKSFKTRVLSYSEQTNKLIKEYLETHNKETLLVNNRGNAVSTRLIEREVRKASLGRFTAHQVRHYYATTFIKSGGNIEALSRLLGHKSVVATQNYTKMNNKELMHEQKKYLSSIYVNNSALDLKNVCYIS